MRKSPLSFKQMITASAAIATLSMGLGIAAPATAAEIIVYDDPFYSGGDRRFSSSVPNLRDQGFNDRIASIRVVSGNWTVCTDADYRGRCISVTGDLTNLLISNMHNKISSIRLEGGGGSGGSSGGDELTLYSNSGYGGRSVTINGDVDRMGQINFNDRASSLRVGGGEWEICEDSHFNGRCEIISGDMNNLNSLGFNDRISSVRYIAPPPPPPASSDRTAEIFDRRDYRGDRRTIEGEVRNLNSEGFNDSISSMRLSGRWEVCEHTNFGGECRVYRGDEADLREDSWNNRISSMRPFRRREEGRRAAMVLFEDVRFGGDRETIREDIPNLRAVGFNNAASSFRIRSGTWEVCERRNYRGRCETFSANQRNLSTEGWDDQISSIRRVDGGGVPDPEGITLFDHSNYGGDDAHFEGDNPDLRAIGFSDRASSLRIHSGTWELCARRDYRGRCRVFDADDSDLSDNNLNDRVNSIRRVVGPREGITLFDFTNFNGDDAHFEGDNPDLSAFGFSDRASSLRVLSGTWELCGRTDYRGRCRVFDADDEDLSDNGIDDRVSSIRRVSGGSGGVVRQGITVYRDTNFAGRDLNFTTEVSSLVSFGFNDMMSSFQIHTGRWELCEHVNFAGRCWFYNADEDDMVSLGNNDLISSLRRAPHGGGGGAGPHIIVHENRGFAGDSRTFYHDTSSLVPEGWNDRISSFEIRGPGRWEVCEHAVYGGRCERFSADENNLRPLNWNNKISSLRYLP